VLELLPLRAGDAMSEWNLDDATLESYIQGFYGQGRYSAPYWFIGMEFGGGNDVAEIVRRIGGWYKKGRPEVEDFERGWTPWFTDHPPLQPTWAKLIRVVLSAEGKAPTTEDMRLYQRDCLARAGSHECLLELLPLPSPGLNRWLFYPEHSRLPYLRDRETYTQHVAPLRIAHLQQRIAEHRPRAVVFYGSGYRDWWSQIAGMEFQPASITKVWVARNEATQFVVMQHPTAHGLGNAYFEAVGRLIADG